VVSFALLCALVVALTLIPMLASRFLRLEKTANPHAKNRFQKIYEISERGFKLVEDQYSHILQWALKHRKTVVSVAFGLFIVSLFLVRFIGVELMPSADEGEVRVNLEMGVGTRLEVIDQAARTVEQIVESEVPEKKSTLTRVAGGGWRASGGHTAEVRVTLVDQKHRNRSSEQIANDLRKKLSLLPGVTIRTRAGQGLFLLRMGTSQDDNVNVEIRGYDLKTAHQLALQVESLIKTVPGITDTRISREEGSPEQTIRIDRQKAASLGLSVTRVGESLQTAVGGTQASYYREGGRQFRILVRLSEKDRKDLQDLLDLTVINDRGEPIILRNVVTAVPSEGPVRIERKDQERIITINANFTGRDMGSIIKDIRDRLNTVPVPRDFVILFGGDYEEQQKAFRELLFGFILAIFLVYMVMAGQFESFRDPFVVLFSIPMALTGIVLTMILSGTIFSMQAFIGCIMLAGIVVNNAILLVDYTNQLRRNSTAPLFEIITLSASRRLRPILMTTLTT
ncbi:MAG: efflux RND transporter permease subunit, partial [bacterium]|nr:efflux RND transporter permease subunit [bacterium]